MTKEEKKEYDKQRYKKNKEKVKEIRKTHYINNKEKIKKKTDEYRKNNIEKCKKAKFKQSYKNKFRNFLCMSCNIKRQ